MSLDTFSYEVHITISWASGSVNCEALVLEPELNHDVNNVQLSLIKIAMVETGERRLVTLHKYIRAYTLCRRSG
jgi:hypothetical protein